MPLPAYRFPAAIILPLALAAVLALAPATLAAPLIETTLQVPVRSERGAPVPFEQVMLARSEYAPSGRRLPFLVLLHGRDADPQHRARLTLPVYPANARYFAEQGYAVLVPLRVGYGATGGPDAESTGDCEQKRYADGVAAAVGETRALLRFARRLAWVDTAHGLIVGESFGGLVAIAAVAARLPGVIGAVNIAGGDGGDSLHHPDSPCRPDQLRGTWATYGTTARLPTLWLYSENDRLWGRTLPQEWFAAFTAAGGRGTFNSLPPDRNNGHFIFGRNAAAWQPAFAAFAAGLGLPPAPARGATGAAAASTRGSPESPPAP
jgi:dienelactone hydrolase